jgi:hypothetical protein
MYRSIILPVVLYGCEKWYLILREWNRRGLFENRVLKKDEMTGGRRNKMRSFITCTFLQV